MALWFIWTLPPSQYRGCQGGQTLGLIESLRCAVQGRKLLYLYLCGFLVMGSFMALFNYISYLLMGEPYGLSPAAIGTLFLLNAAGSVVAPVAGRLTGSYSHGVVLGGAIIAMMAGCWLTLAEAFVLKVAGMLLFGGAFAAGHTTISGWVGRVVTFDQAQAQAWYLTFYYAGSVTAGTAGGYFWTVYHWPGVVTMISVMLTTAWGINLYHYRSEGAKLSTG